jgi:hypothetical protein
MHHSDLFQLICERAENNQLEQGFDTSIIRTWISLDGPQKTTIKAQEKSVQRPYRIGLFCYDISYTIDQIGKIYFIVQMWYYDVTPIPPYEAFTPRSPEIASDEDDIRAQRSWFSAHLKINSFKTNCSQKFHENMKVIDMSMPLHFVDSSFSERNARWFSNWMNQLKKVWIMSSISDRDESLHIEWMLGQFTIDDRSFARKSRR